MNEMDNLERDTLFATWCEARAQGTYKPLKVWLAEYPQFADDLMQWALDVPVMEYAEKQPLSTADQEQVAQIGSRFVAEMRARYETPVSSLLEVARQNGLNAASLAQRLGVGMPIIAKLQQRLIRFASIPDRLISEMADALKLNIHQVRAFLQQPPTLAAGAVYNYRADSAPQVSKQEDFEEAVRACPDMSETQKTTWLAPGDNRQG